MNTSFIDFNRHKRNIFLFSLLIIFLTFFLFFVLYVTEDYDIKDFRITNISDSSLTVSWESDSDRIAKVFIREDENWTFLFDNFISDKVFFDDRDIEQTEKGYLLKEGGSKSRKIHHVTIRNLNDLSTYYIKIGGTFKSFTPPQKALYTVKIKDWNPSPDVGYGLVKDYISKESIEDGIVYYGLFDSSGSRVSEIFSSTTNADGGWSFDMTQLLGTTDSKVSKKNLLNYQFFVSVKSSHGKYDGFLSLENTKPISDIYINSVFIKDTYSTLSKVRTTMFISNSFPEDFSVSCTSCGGGTCPDGTTYGGDSCWWGGEGSCGQRDAEACAGHQSNSQPQPQPVPTPQPEATSTPQPINQPPPSNGGDATSCKDGTNAGSSCIGNDGFPVCLSSYQESCGPNGAMRNVTCDGRNFVVGACSGGTQSASCPAGTIWDGSQCAGTVNHQSQQACVGCENQSAKLDETGQALVGQEPGNIVSSSGTNYETTIDLSKYPNASNEIAYIDEAVAICNSANRALYVGVCTQLENQLESYNKSTQYVQAAMANNYVPETYQIQVQLEKQRLIISINQTVTKVQKVALNVAAEDGSLKSSGNYETCATSEDIGKVSDFPDGKYRCESNGWRKIGGMPECSTETDIGKTGQAVDGEYECTSEGIVKVGSNDTQMCNPGSRTCTVNGKDQEYYYVCNEINNNVYAFTQTNDRCDGKTNTIVTQSCNDETPTANGHSNVNGSYCDRSCHVGRTATDTDGKQYKCNDLSKGWEEQTAQSVPAETTLNTGQCVYRDSQDQDQLCERVSIESCTTSLIGCAIHDNKCVSTGNQCRLNNTKESCLFDTTGCVWKPYTTSQANYSPKVAGVSTTSENPPAPEVIDPALLNTGVYTISIPGYDNATVEIYADGVQVQYFGDINGNGIQDTNEPNIDLGQFQIQVSKIKTTEQFNLQSGWNLISLPFISEEFSTASELMGIGLLQGANLVQASKYDNGNWIHFIVRFDEAGNVQTYGNDFNLIPGEGIFIRAITPSILILSGNEFTSQVPIKLNAGWNLVGVHGPTIYNSKTFLEKCLATNIMCQSITKFNGSYYENMFYDNGQYYGNSFELEKKSGYFVLNKSDQTILEL